VKATLIASAAGAIAREAEGGGAEVKNERLKRAVYFTALDLQRDKATAVTGFKVALGRHLDKPGFRMLAMAKYALNERDPVLLARRNRALGGRVLVGHEWHTGSGAVSLYAGYALIANDSATWIATGSQFRQGGAALAELWQNWSRTGPMPAGHSLVTVLADQAQKSLYLRVRQGIDLPWKGVSLGPEVSLSLGMKDKKRGVLVQSAWKTLRIGGYLAGVPIGSRFRLGLGGGYEFTDQGRSGPYVKIATLVTY
jgi:hypothetical protein